MMLLISEKWIARGVIVSFCASLIAHILILPPYEGFDENAHYSYISFLSDTHQIPKLNESSIDQNIEDLWLVLPKPYHSVPPYEQNGGLTYQYFYNELSNTDREDVGQRYWVGDNHKRKYVPSQTLNWLAQHPPLFYVVMLVPYRFSQDWSPGFQLLFLRFISVFIGLGSLVFWVKALRVISDENRICLLLGGLCMLFFPSLFFDLGRLGNDTLVALLASGVFYYMLMVYVAPPEQRLNNWIKLSILMGLGLLTKLFFLPLALGVFVYYTVMWYFRSQKLDLMLFKHLMIYGIILFLVSAWWFILSYYRYGMIFISEEVSQLSQMNELLGEQLSWIGFGKRMVRSFASFGASFLWSGSWSWLRRPLEHYLLWIPLFAFMLKGIYKSQNSQKFIKSVSFVGLFLFIPLMVGFVLHMYMRIKFTGEGTGTGGYYLFIIWPILGIFVAYSFQGNDKVWKRWGLFGAFGCLLLFEIVGEWRLIQLYVGVLAKVGSAKEGVGGLSLSFDHLNMVLSRLNLLAFPYLAVGCYLLASVIKFVLVGFICFQKRSRLQI